MNPGGHTMANGDGIAVALEHREEVVHAHSKHSIETVILGLLGVAMIALKDMAHSFSTITETIVLVVVLGGVMGITHISLPKQLFGKPIKTSGYPVLSGVISSVMDSFLVLLLLGRAELSGEARQQFRFKVYTMLAALIGGLMLYFGEVYFLPLGLRYGMREWHSMLPIVPPVMVFLVLLGYLASKTGVTVVGMKAGKQQANKFDYIEFGAIIALILITHNALLTLGILFAYASVTGQGEDLIDVMKTETEMSVMLLLVLAGFVAEPIQPYMAHFTGWLAFIPSTINGVLTGAIYPASGDVWKDTHVLSTAVLLTPISSLVGVMIFKSAKEWVGYIKLAVPLAGVWFVMYGLWFYLAWPHLDPLFYSWFPKPVLQ